MTGQEAREDQPLGAPLVSFGGGASPVPKHEARDGAERRYPQRDTSRTSTTQSHTPTTEAVRSAYIWAMRNAHVASTGKAGEEFDRWLAETRYGARRRGTA